MLSHHFTRGRTCFAAALLGLSSQAFAGPPQVAQTNYDELTNTYRSAANFNVETVRGLHVAASLRVLMINTHGSTLNMWVPGMPTSAPFFWPTLNNPIAVDAFSQPTGPTSAPIEYGVVLGGGTHALALHDLATGRIVSTLQLPAETGDLVVDQEGARAFVSLPGNNTVWQIGLPKLTVDAVFTVASQRPRFLYLDLGGDGVEDNLVYVAPELSGNNTVSLGSLQNPVTLGLDFRTLFALPLDLKSSLPDGLPDEDLFVIKPQPPPGGAPPTLAAQAVLRNAGTILNAHGRNPVTGAHWIVGVEALNAIGNTIAGVIAATTEPLVNGKFALNRLTIAPTLGSAPIPHTNTFIDLDLVGPTYNSIYSISAPYGLAFHPTGYAAISGVASDQIRALDPAGLRVGDIELPPGSMPRSMAFDSTGVFMFVYCWGTNEVRLYDVNALLVAMAGNPNQIAPVGAGYLLSFPLGADPASERIRHGRELFYDGDNSADGRFTCHHCHPGGGMDLIGWNIQDFPHDHKDLMVTQSLKSIEDTFPYHWRGERDLEAFNGAFAGLLGGSKLSETAGGDFEDFKAFVFSLQAHANPKQALSRKLDPSRSTLQSMFEVPPPPPPALPPPPHAVGDPAIGQALMDTPNTLLDRFSCAQCHSKVAGSVGDPNIVDLFSTIATNITMDPAHFRQLTHKNQDVVPVRFLWNGAPIQFNTVRSGYGLSHDGDHSSIFDFLNRNPFDFTRPEKEHLAAFVEQADEGIAPAAHVAYTINSGTRAAVLTEIDTVVLPQAGATFQASHWVSFAIIGSHRDINGVTHDLTWWFLPASQTFFASNPTVVFPNGATGSQTWTALKAEAAAGHANFTLLGLPPGSALRFAHDPDDDGLSNHDEGLVGADRFVRDSDGDGELDGHEAFNGGDPANAAIQVERHHAARAHLRARRPHGRELREVRTRVQRASDAGDHGDERDDRTHHRRAAFRSAAVGQRDRATLAGFVARDQLRGGAIHRWLPDSSDARRRLSVHTVDRGDGPGRKLRDSCRTRRHGHARSTGRQSVRHRPGRRNGWHAARAARAHGREPHLGWDSGRGPVVPSDRDGQGAFRRAAAALRVHGAAEHAQRKLESVRASGRRRAGAPPELAHRAVERGAGRVERRNADRVVALGPTVQRRAHPRRS